MKTNYNLKLEQGIKKTTLLSSTIIILIVATITGYNLIKIEYDNFKKYCLDKIPTTRQRDMYSKDWIIEKYGIIKSREEIKESIQ